MRSKGSYLNRQAIAAGYFSYETFLKSPYWAGVRQKRIVKGSTRCFCCATADHILHLHHITYERLGAELPQDLIPICGPCHERLHEKVRRGQVSLENAHWSVLKEMTRGRKLSKRRKKKRKRPPTTWESPSVRRYEEEDERLSVAFRHAILERDPLEI